MERAFYDLEQFPDFKNLASQFPVIVEELNKNSLWLGWGSDYSDPSGHCKFLEGDWTICPIYFGNYSPYFMKLPTTKQYGVRDIVESLPKRFPESTKLLQSIKSLNYSAFSRLHPKSKLAPHKHQNHKSLIFHLGLIIPAGSTCGLCVNNEVHLWTKPGDAVIFDDTLEHSAWNDSDEERIVLYVDFQRTKD